MIICRALLALAIVGSTIPYAGAQFGGMPGMPGAPGAGGGFGGPPAGPPPKCQALLSIRDDLQKHGKSIEEANNKKSDVKVACRLFRNYIATEAKMLKMLEVDGPSCGAGPRSSSRSVVATPRPSRSASRCATPPRADPRRPVRP